MNARGRWRRLALGLPTVLGLARRGFFIPYRYAATLPDAATLAPYAAAENLFAAHRAEFAAVLDDLATYRDALAAIALDRAPGAPRFDQDWFPTLDAAVAYRMVRRLKPARIVEIGSGHSTRFLARAIGDGALATDMTAIDPAPRAAIRALPIRHIADTIPPRGSNAGATGADAGRADANGAGGAALAAIASLDAGDVLFVDSSHILVPGSDVDFLVNRVLPALPPGALVHIHDMLLPDPYPARWDWYGYNEQNAVLPLLTGGAFRPLFASHYAATRMADALARSAIAALPQAPDALPASLWLEKLR